MNITLKTADYNDPSDAQDFITLLDEYARDPMGGGEGLGDEVKADLAQALAQRNDALTVLCYVDGKPAGLINCIEGFSTFKCKPLLNIHDVVVSKPFRGLGLSQTMLVEVEKIARQRNCCKLTLEVLEGNETARNAYIKFGFSGYELDPQMGKALFWEKALKPQDN